MLSAEAGHEQCRPTHPGTKFRVLGFPDPPTLALCSVSLDPHSVPFGPHLVPTLSHLVPIWSTLDLIWFALGPNFVPFGPTWSHLITWSHLVPIATGQKANIVKKRVNLK